MMHREVAIRPRTRALSPGLTRPTRASTRERRSAQVAPAVDVHVIGESARDLCHAACPLDHRPLRRRARAGARPAWAPSTWAVDPLIEREVRGNRKVLPLAGADEHSDRLIAEARGLWAAYFHPNIVGVFDIGEEQGEPFVVMLFLAAPSRRSSRIATGRPSTRRCRQPGWHSCASALAYARRADR